MITHKIDKHPETVVNWQKQTWQQPGVTYPVTKWTRKVSFEMGKLEYAMFLRNLGLAKDDLIVHKMTPFPYTKFDVFQIASIQELHRFVEFASAEEGPKCLTICNIDGVVMPFQAGANLYRKVPYWQIPDEWRPFLKESINVNI